MARCLGCLDSKRGSVVSAAAFYQNPLLLCLCVMGESRERLFFSQPLFELAVVAVATFGFAFIYENQLCVRVVSKERVFFLRSIQ